MDGKNRAENACCSVCGSRNVNEFVTVDDLPLLIFPVDEAVKDDVVTKTITSFECGECHHVFTAPLRAEDTELLYGEYYRYYPYDNLETMNSAYRLPFERFFAAVFEKHRGRTKPETLLEIGCSSGDHLKSFERYGLQCRGIDPSPLNTDRSGNIIRGLYETHEFREEYDVIVSRFNLEHVSDVHAFCEKASSDLSDGGLLFVQVPNIPLFAANFIPFFLAHEHVQYFNPYSLASACSKHGLAVADIEYVDSQSILIAVQKRLTADVADDCPSADVQPLSPSFYSDYARKRTDVARDVNTFLNDRSDVHFYGAGLTLAWILYDLRYRGRETCVTAIDDNPLVHGKFLPRTSCRISALDVRNLGTDSTVLCTLNPTYHPTVMRRLVDAGYRGEVFAVDSTGLHEVVPQ